MPSTLDTWLDAKEETQRVHQQLLHAYSAARSRWHRPDGVRTTRPLVKIIIDRPSSANPAPPWSQTEGPQPPETGEVTAGSRYWRKLAELCRRAFGPATSQRGQSTDYASVVLWTDAVEPPFMKKHSDTEIHRVEPVRELYPRPRARLRSFLETETRKEPQLAPGFSETVFETSPVSEHTIRTRIIFDGPAPPPQFVID